MKKIVLTSLLAAVSVQPALAQDLDITISNLTHGSHFTPLLVGAHPGTTRLFEVGMPASAHLTEMAEGGAIDNLMTDLNAVGADSIANPASGLLGPGQSTSLSVSTNSGNDYLSIVSMVLPSNDGFVGLDSLSVPSQAGTYTYYLNAYDAGTEVNDEIVNGGGAPGAPGIPVDPLGMNGENGSGVTNVENNTRVHIHRGVLGDTDAMGGISDLDSRIHRWLNPVARVVVTVN